MLVSLLLVSLPQAASANHRNRTLDVAPESANQPLGATQTLTATVSRAATVRSGTLNIDFENEGGVNDTDGTTRTAPDLTCSIAAGATSCTVAYSGSDPGRDQWRSWIDHDGVNTTVEADVTEGRNETANAGGGGQDCPGAGTGGEPDCTDVVEVIWGTGGLDCDDGGGDTEHHTNPAGGGTVSNEAYTCTLTDAAGRPRTDAPISAEVENGINDPDATDGASYDSPDYTCTTGTGTGNTTAGVCRITVTQNENETGTAQICFWAGTAAEGQSFCSDEPTDENKTDAGTDEGNDLADRVEKTWEAPRAAGIDVENETARNRLGAQHQLTVAVYDQFGSPFVGNTTIALEFFRGSPSDEDSNSLGSPDLSCTTQASARCSLTYSATLPGTDLLCAFGLVGPVTPPPMEGTNNNGTCGGEPLAVDGDTSGAVEASTDPIDVVQKIWQQPTRAARLDCAPETSTNRRNTSHTIICAATDPAGIAVPAAEIDAELVGVNDIEPATEGDSPTTPDLISCITDAAGRCALTHGPGGEGTSDLHGTTTYRIWIDQDNDNATTEADLLEGRNETTTPGSAEPDVTDVVEKRWKGARCDVVGTAGPDRLEGTAGPDVICGFGGRDTILGGGGNDRLLGDSGKDEIVGGSGADLIEGRGGHDVLRGSRGHDRLRGGRGDDRIYGGRGSDRCTGGRGRDVLRSC